MDNMENKDIIILGLVGRICCDFELVSKIIEENYGLKIRELHSFDQFIEEYLKIK